MKTTISENGYWTLEKDCDRIVLKTENEGLFTITTIDDTIEMSVVGSDVWYKVDMETGEIEEL